MSGANVLDVHVLEDLKAALARFGGEAGQALNAAAMEVRRTLEWLGERQAYWQAEVRRRQELMRRAEADLRACLCSGDRDHPPSCGAYEQRLLEARVYLARAEAALREAQAWTRLVERSAADYQVQARRLGALVAEDLPRARALLERKIATLESYVATTAPSGGAPAPPAAWAAPSAGPPSPPPEPSDDRVTPYSGYPGMSGTVERERGPESTEGGWGGPERGG